jgi:RNA polymerase sigma-70 factor, ECF subfamily
MTARRTAAAPNPEHEASLVLAATRGDQRAFRVLYARHHRGVQAHLTKLIGAGPDRDDLLQEVFLQLYRSLPNFRGDSGLSTFLHRITRNVAIDYLRRQSRHQRLDYDHEALACVEDTGQDPEQHSCARQQLRTLLHQLDRLTKDKRQALFLVVISGLSLNQAADRLGASRVSIKQRLVCARRDLAAWIARSHATTAHSMRPPHRPTAALRSMRTSSLPIREPETKREREETSSPFAGSSD